MLPSLYYCFTFLRFYAFYIFPFCFLFFYNVGDICSSVGKSTAATIRAIFFERKRPPTTHRAFGRVINTKHIYFKLSARRLNQELTMVAENKERVTARASDGVEIFQQSVGISCVPYNKAGGWA